MDLPNLMDYFFVPHLIHPPILCFVALRNPADKLTNQPKQSNQPTNNKPINQPTKQHISQQMHNLTSGRGNNPHRLIWDSWFMQGFHQTAHSFITIRTHTHQLPTFSHFSITQWKRLALFLLYWCVNNFFQPKLHFEYPLDLKRLFLPERLIRLCECFACFVKGSLGVCFLLWVIQCRAERMQHWLCDKPYLFGNVDFICSCVFVRIFLAVSGVLFITKTHLFANWMSLNLCLYTIAYEQSTVKLYIHRQSGCFTLLKDDKKWVFFYFDM